MLEATPQSTFHGLPLTPERDAEVRALHKEENAAWCAAGHAGVGGHA
jgi:hypothetical protein